MSSLNKVMLIGRVGKTPEIKTFEGGTKKSSFTLATSEKYNDKEITEWHNIVFWGKIVDVVEKYVNKGDLLYVEGKVTSRSYEANDGAKKYITEIVCSSMTMLGSKSNKLQNDSQDKSELSPQSSDLPF